MFTPPDGIAPRMQMYLWRLAASAASSAARRVDPLPRVHARALEPAGARRRRLRRAELRAGGRDGRGLERLVRAGLHRRPVPGARHRRVGRGRDGRLHGPRRLRPRSRATRRWTARWSARTRSRARARPCSARAGSPTATSGAIAGGAEVHADGEIWAQTLWDLRTALGSAKARALVTTGCRCCRPSRPSWTAATRSCSPTRRLFGGADADLVWASSRGAAWASSRRRSGGDDTAPAENFALPPRGRRAARARSPAGHRTRSGGAGVAGVHGGAGGRAEHRERGDRRRRPLHDRRRPAGDLLEGDRGRRRVGRRRASLSVTRRRDDHLRRGGEARLGGDQGRAPRSPRSNGADYVEYGCGPNAALDQSQSARLVDDRGHRQVPDRPAAGRGRRHPVRDRPDRDLRRLGSEPRTGGYRVETSPDGSPGRSRTTGTFVSRTATR